MDGAFTLEKFIAAIGLVCLLPIIWRLAKERRRRWKYALCPRCGYDVRECKERCSECGAAIPENWRDPTGEPRQTDDQ